MLTSGCLGSDVSYQGTSLNVLPSHPSLDLTLCQASHLPTLTPSLHECPSLNPFWDFSIPFSAASATQTLFTSLSFNTPSEKPTPYTVSLPWSAHPELLSCADTYLTVPGLQFPLHQAAPQKRHPHSAWAPILYTRFPSTHTETLFNLTNLICFSSPTQLNAYRTES